MSHPRSKRRTRKPRGRSGAAPRAVTSPRRQERAERAAAERRQTATAKRTLGSVGERPQSPFGGLPISEIAIFAGLVGVIVGLIQGGGLALIVGAIVCGLGVTEVTAREHFSGFRSHTMLLAAIPAVAVETAIALIFGVPSNRALLILPAVAVFGICFWLLRRNFQSARHARVVRPPAP